MDRRGEGAPDPVSIRGADAREHGLGLVYRTRRYRTRGLLLSAAARSRCRRRGRAAGRDSHVRGEHPDVLLHVPDVLLHVVDVFRDAGVRFPVLGAHVIYAPVRTVHERVHHAGERNAHRDHRADDRRRVGVQPSSLCRVLHAPGRPPCGTTARVVLCGWLSLLSKSSTWAPLNVAEREELTETGLGSTARCCGRRRHRQANSVRVCSPTSRRVASLRPRSAGLTALTSAPRTLVQTGSCRRCPLIHPLHVVVAVLSRMTPFPATVDTQRS